MPNRLQAAWSALTSRSDPTLTLQQWVDMATLYFQGNAYTVAGLNQSLGQKQEDIAPNFRGLSANAFGANSVVFACMLARMQLFTEARFQFQRMRKGRPGDLFGNESLEIIEHPWPGAVTADLLARASFDVDLGGNFFGVRRDRMIKRARPDWTTIILGSKRDPDQSGWAIDAVPLGYAYQPGGLAGGQPLEFLLREEVMHYVAIPDPLANFRGMSWMVPLIREIQADSAATAHKLQFFENGATPNMVVSLDKDIDLETFSQWVASFKEAEPAGILKAYKTLYLGAGANVEVIGANLRQMDFKITQGAGETRIAAAAGVPPIIVGLSEGLQAATYSNYGQARRRFADNTMRPLWRNFAGSLETIIPPPDDSRIWYDDRDIQALAEDQKDRAEVLASHASSIRQLGDAGYDPDAVIDAVMADDLSQLKGKHSGLFSVQLQPAGGNPPSPNGAGPAGPPPDTEMPPLPLVPAARDELLLKLVDLVKERYSPDQPRVPAGSSEGGQWTSEGGGSEAHPTGAGLEARAKEVFGLTDDIREAGYITPDGSMLDFSGRHQSVGYHREGDRFVPSDPSKPHVIGGITLKRPPELDYLAGQRAVDHREVGPVFEGMPGASGGEEGMRALINDGFVRVLSGAEDLGLEINRPLSEAQFRRLSSASRDYPSVTIDVVDSGGITKAIVSNFTKPGTSNGAILRQATEKAVELAAPSASREQLIAWAFELAAIRYSPDQPRDPKGTSTGGKFTSGGPTTPSNERVAAALAAIKRGERPSIAAADVPAFMDAVAREPEVVDLTELHVEGTAQFGDDGLGIARADMPVLESEGLTTFLGELEDRDIAITTGTISPQELQPIQKEVSAQASSFLLGKMRDGSFDSRSGVVISSDNYVIDGHHRWGAAVAFSFERDDFVLPFVKIDVPARELLEEARAFTQKAGIKSKKLGERDRGIELVGRYSPDQPRVPAGVPEGGQFSFAEGAPGLNYKSLDDAAEGGGFSTTIHGDVPEGGFMVSPYRGAEAVYDVKTMTADDVRAYRYKHRGLLGKPDHYLGGWRDGDKVYLDVSVHAVDAAGAEAIAMANDQLAYYDLTTGQTVYVKGKGKAA